MVKVKTNSLYHRPKRSSNKIRILLTKFEFEKKNEFNIPYCYHVQKETLTEQTSDEIFLRHFFITLELMDLFTCAQLHCEPATAIQILLCIVVNNYTKNCYVRMTYMTHSNNAQCEKHKWGKCDNNTVSILNSQQYIHSKM